jgi:hypothetical protein
MATLDNCDFDLKEPLSDLHIHMRVEAVQEAIKRARFAFFLCVLAAVAGFVCLWNTHLSWYREFGFKAMPAAVGTATAADPREQTRAALLRDELRSWVDSQTVDIDLLGIRISVSDFAILNSLAMYLFTYYFLLSTRRENREIGALLRDLSNEPNARSYAVYSAISAFMIFNLNKGDDAPIATIKPDCVGPYRLRIIRKLSVLMVYMPFATVAFTIICDIASLRSTSHMFFSSPFRSTYIWGDLDLTARFYAAVLESVAVIVCFGIFRLLRHVTQYDKATRQVLEEFRNILIQAGYIAPAPVISKTA